MEEIEESESVLSRVRRRGIVKSLNRMRPEFREKAEREMEMPCKIVIPAK